MKKKINKINAKPAFVYTEKSIVYAVCCNRNKRTEEHEAPSGGNLESFDNLSINARVL